MNPILFYCFMFTINKSRVTSNEWKFSKSYLEREERKITNKTIGFSVS